MRPRRDKIDSNQELVARRGREPGLVLQRRERAQRLHDWAEEIAGALEGICECLDSGLPDQPYRRALGVQREAIRHPEGLPSSRLLDELRTRREGFFEFAMRKSHEFALDWRAARLAAPRHEDLSARSEASRVAQARTEAADRVGFAEYLRAYFAEELDTAAREGESP